MSRKKREDATDRRPNGVEVGRYNPKYYHVDKKTPTNTFHQFDFLTDAEREKLLQEYEVETEKQEKLELSPNKRKKMAKSKLDRIQPPQRPDPFKPKQSVYNSRPVLMS